MQIKNFLISIYISILISRFFYLIIIIIIKFDLELKLFDIINIFINTKKNNNFNFIIYKILLEFEDLIKIIKIDYILYKIKDFFVL